MAKKKKAKAVKKLKYFLDHPQIKRAKSPGNGMTPVTSTNLSSAATSAKTTKKPSIAEQINFGGKFR